ncbi:MAG: anaerobic glycerol-3-phosphate dehydrogenase subunit C [Acidimicrobiales bacterium]
MSETESLPDLVRGSLDHCIKCTICETYCPVSNVTPLFPGPKYVGPQAERFRRRGESPDASLDYCSGCGVCTRVCPHGVKIAEINSRARAELKARTGIPWRDRLIARPSLMGRAASPVAPLANWTLGSGPARALVERVIGVHRHAPMPRFAGRTFRRWADHHLSPAAATRSVVYFHGCSTNWFEPGLGEMTVAVLEHNGFSVAVPEQGCCGLPLQSNGIFDTARRYVSQLVDRLAPYAHRGLPIVATSTSCGLMLKREAHEILGLDDPDLHVVSDHLYDICELLLDLHERGELRTDLLPLPRTVTYHAPCQQRGHGIGKPALDLLALVPDLSVIELDRECCGIAGTYGLKEEKYQIAMDVGAPLFDDIRDAAPDAAVCDSETCRWQIRHGSGVSTVHPVALLYEAYGLGGA